MQQGATRARAIPQPTAGTAGRGAEPVADPTRVPRRSPARFPHLSVIGALVFCSGACGLVYQTAWLRELRAIFGASTPATAAVLAIFMGGLGLGSILLGPRVDRDRSPLQFYGMLELMIAATAAASPALLGLARVAYLALGGTWVLGAVLGTIAQLALAALVLGVPAMLMGGTLPAIARATGHGDAGRRRLALMYGTNTAGAVFGVGLATFVLLEHLGVRATVWVAALLNMAAGLGSIALARAPRGPGRALQLIAPAAAAPRPAGAHDAPAGAGKRHGRAPAAERAAPRPAEERTAPVPAPYVYTAAGLVGFVFFLMEMVWYRMLTPLLGGTTFTFGLILAVALLGISLGSVLYGARRRAHAPAPELFALTCALEALALAIPFALGDRLAILAVLLHPLGQLSFHGHVAAWAFLAGVVVLPAAMVAGYQFPMLVRLLGRGRRDIGMHTGRAYAWNTAGAIAGALAGGFGILPWLTAPGVWRLATALLATLSLLALIVSLRSSWWRPRGACALATALAAVLLVALPAGPTAFWRHTAIGAGLLVPADIATPNETTRFVRDSRRATLWQADGRESSIAVQTDGGLALIVGGKADGNAIGDAGTQVMLGMLGVLLHPRPQRALVIGLGTGSTSGWLARAPSIERVDTIELEPAIARVAELCATANLDLMRNPRARLLIGDGRDFLQTTRERYDLIISEPSNPYRAGVGSLYTREFYCAAASRLSGDGLFIQWVQAYDADFETLRIVFATIRSVFPVVEVWNTSQGDLALVGSLDLRAYDVEALRARAAEEPLRSALQRAWGALDLEGVTARFVGDAGFVASVAAMGPPVLNTDDHPVLEYRFARQVGGSDLDLDDLRVLSFLSDGAAPPWAGLDRLDGESVAVQKGALHVLDSDPPPLPPDDHPAFARIAAMRAFVLGNHPLALELWQKHGEKLSDLTELAVAAELLADAGDPGAPALIERLRPHRPVEADFLQARQRLNAGDLPGATAAFESGCAALHSFPWVWRARLDHMLAVGAEIAGGGQRELDLRLYRALERPFSEWVSNRARLRLRLAIARELDEGRPSEYMREALEEYGPWVPWDARTLAERLACYERLGDPRTAAARRDLMAFRKNEPATPPIEALAGP